jgi:hypothetical protein
MDNSEQSENQPTAESNWKYNPADSGQEYDGEDVSDGVGVPLQPIPAVEWTASEYIAHEKSGGWYGALIAGGVLLVAFIYIVTRDILASIVILLSCVAIGVYAGRKPATKKYMLNEKGVQADEKFHPYSEFKSFSVVEEGAIDSIWLKPLKRFRPIVVMYCSPEDEQRIVDVLANFLPNEERELDAIDRFSKRIRF